MTGVAMLQAALAALRDASATADTQSSPELALSLNVLTAAVAGAAIVLNASTMNDVEFATNDVRASIDELSQGDADRLTPLLTTFGDHVAALKAATALDPVLIANIRTFQAKLRERMTAIERQTYVEGGSDMLPHSPETLRQEAVPLGRELYAAGFATPALDALIADPGSFHLHSLRELFDELDVITG
jgi:hypothetical protein